MRYFKIRSVALFKIVQSAILMKLCYNDNDSIIAENYMMYITRHSPDNHVDRSIPSLARIGLRFELSSLSLHTWWIHYTQNRMLMTSMRPWLCMCTWSMNWSIGARVNRIVSTCIWARMCARLCARTRM